MKKVFQQISQGELKVQIAQTVDVVNTANSVIHIMDQAAFEAIQVLEFEESTIVKDALFSILPGASKRLTTGTYQVDFNGSNSASAISYTITHDQKKEKPKPQPAPVEPADSGQPAQTV